MAPINTNVIRVAVLLLLLALHIPGSGQIVLDSYHNAPMKEYRYVMDTAIFPYHLAIPGGPDLTWDLSELIKLNDTSSQYYTGNPNYNSFPGIPVHDYPLPGDTTCLYSDSAIYRLTESLFWKAYVAVTYPFGYGTFVEETSDPILMYPFHYLDLMYQDTIHGGNFNGNDVTIFKKKKSDAWGTLMLPDTTYPDVLRIYAYYLYDVYVSHSGYGWITETYEWFDRNSEVPILKVVAIDTYDWYFGPPTHTYDTIAAVYAGKMYQPCTIGIQEPGGDSGLRIFPCPAKDVINVITTNPVDQVEFYKPTGELVYVHNPGIVTAGKITIQLDNPSLTSGIYFLRFLARDGSVASEKVIISK